METMRKKKISSKSGPKLYHYIIKTKIEGNNCSSDLTFIFFEGIKEYNIPRATYSNKVLLVYQTNFFM